MTNAASQPLSDASSPTAGAAPPARSGFGRWVLLLACVAVSVGGWQWYVAHRAEQTRRKLAATERMVALEQQSDLARAGGERLVAGLAAGKLGEWQRLAVSVRSADAASRNPDGPKPLFDEITAPVFADMERKLRAAAGALGAADADWQEVERVLDAAAAFLPQASHVEQRLLAYLAAPVWGAATAACEDPAFAERFALAPMPHLARARAALVAGNDAEVAAALAGLGWLYEPERVKKWVGLAAATRREVQRLNELLPRAGIERALRQLQRPPGMSDPVLGAANATVNLSGDGPAAWLQAEAVAVEARWSALDVDTDVARWERALARAAQLVRLVDHPRETPLIREAFDAAPSAVGTVAMTAWVNLQAEMQRFLENLWACDAGEAEARARSLDAAAAECLRWTAEVEPTKALVRRWEAVPEVHREKAVPTAATTFAAATANPNIDFATWQAARDAFAKAATAAGEVWLAACLAMPSEHFMRRHPKSESPPPNQPSQGDTLGGGRLGDEPIMVDKRAVAMVLVVDRSGSMGALLRDGNTKMNYAKTSARRTAETMSAGDRVGVVTFGNKGEGRIELPLTDVADAAKVQDGVANLRHAQEFTYLLGGLRIAVDSLRPVQASMKHIVVISDGEFDPNEEFALRSLARGACERDKITVSIITIADSALGPVFQRMAEGIAREGGGEFVIVNEAVSLPEFVNAEVTRSLARFGRTPRAGDSAQPGALQSSIEATPPSIVSEIDCLIAWFQNDARLEPLRAAVVAERLRRAGLNAAPETERDAVTGLPRRVIHTATGAELILIAAGEFTMGSPVDEPQRDISESQHRRHIRRPFYLGVTEVTQAQWRKVMGGNPSRFKGDDLPVEQVSWDDCQEFLQKAGDGLRLPSEAEWEYACRAGTSTPFAFGSTIAPDQVNYDGNYPYGGAIKGRFRERTVAAGSLPANAWGLHEMHGNVWEWCHDGYEAYPSSGTEAPAIASGKRVLRGGSWDINAYRCRAATRLSFEPGGRFNDLGLRLARTLPE